MHIAIEFFDRLVATLTHVQTSSRLHVLCVQVLNSKIAERKRRKAEKLAENQRLEMDKLLLDQSTVRKQLELDKVIIIMYIFMTYFSRVL